MDQLKLKFFYKETMFFIFLGLLIFVPSWTVFYWQGWLYLFIVSLSVLIMTFYFLKHDRVLMESRINIGPKAEKKKSQKIILSSFSILFIGLISVSAMDHRYNLSNVPVLFNIISYIMIPIGFYVVFRVQKQNSFASATIEVMKEQKVISTGPYAVVRHPMYSGASLFFLFSPVALDSLLGIIPAALIIVIVIFRILDEEKYLIANLSGYPDYCKKIKFRLVPYIW